MAHFTLSIKYSIKSRKLSRCNYSVKSSRVYSKPLAGARAGDGGAIIGEDQGYIDGEADGAGEGQSDGGRKDGTDSKPRTKHLLVIA